ncbi:MAG: tRNA (N6-isopentenyl adenosine(37)-C2)-methylthiotransferase MiaB [Proteobacteria bacterium]|nr:tRNA (N6-isopentenyl adenosine(37)-C2)-methylthiotransferase MiaB [Pseudomonadota bacterium]MBU4583393.1 tRNA (N6-isopentenyl adenosine(37)-C2)-methylthiotransferase MiaB [Pseudomonadota bacterium]MCG2741251.1 tRNA (N6-isopentenyl adenosine(37)-C2)-methylthiotransferase MiaB [Syntrophaceae bacterium]
MGKKKLYIQTFGCQMNVQDAQKMAVLLEESGYGTTEDPELADLILVNTCSIREKAAQKIYSQLGRFRELKERNPLLLIGVGGCLAQQWGDRFFRRVPYLDLVVGTHQIHRLPEMVCELEGAGGRIVETGFCDRVGSLDIPAQPAAGAVSTFVTIMQGCNNFCAYCVVPHLRGREQSRPLPDILREIETLAARGIREVTLLGQNVNSYGHTLPGETDFTQLINAIGKVPGIGRIRFTTSHPKDLSPRLIASFGEIASLCEHIHLPVQSGSDLVLRRMNRGYTAEAYREKVAELRRICPQISITSDVIVGFPGEEEEDFQQTLELMREIRFDNLFSFQYSEREGTAAVGMDRPVHEGVKRERLRALQALQEEHTLDKNRACVGRRETVLVEGPSRNGCEDMTGRTRGNRIVNFPGRTGLIGKTVSVRIVEAFAHSLRGEVEERGGADAH